MAEGADFLTVNIGALSNATRAITHPRTGAQGGGYTVRGASAVQSGSTNSSLRLLKGTESGGTFTANGTLDSAAIGGTAAPFAANVRQTWTLGSSVYVSASEVLAVIEGNVAAAATTCLIQLEYSDGK